MSEVIDIKPQIGPQTIFATTSATLAIFGGAAGGGKSWSLIYEPMRHLDNPKFNAVIFRRTWPEIDRIGGLWDEASAMYPLLKGKSSTDTWYFPSGMRITFSHLEDEKDKLRWMGSQVPLFEFDQLESFTETQFWYLFSRLRSMSGVPGYVRCSVNPVPSGFVRELVDWYIDPDTGYPIKDRSGVIRWLCREQDHIVFGDSKQELINEYGKDKNPISFTFIPSKLSDNPILTKKDPGYKAKLEMLSYVERMQLLEGNWNIAVSAGNMFRSVWWEIIQCAFPMTMRVRAWDFAATKPEKGKEPDWTVGLLLARDPRGIYCVEDVIRFQDTPFKVKEAVLNTAGQDGGGTTITIPRDPGAAGVSVEYDYVSALAGYNVVVCPTTKAKDVRARPVSSQVEHGFVKILSAPWNKGFTNRLENFPTAGVPDDEVDALSDAFNTLSQMPLRFDYQAVEINSSLNNRYGHELGGIRSGLVRGNKIM